MVPIFWRFIKAHPGEIYREACCCCRNFRAWLREASRADLVGEHTGATAIKALFARLVSAWLPVYLCMYTCLRLSINDMKAYDII